MCIMVYRMGVCKYYRNLVKEEAGPHSIKILSSVLTTSDDCNENDSRSPGRVAC